MNSFKLWLKKSRMLLAPSLHQCLICGKKGRPSADLPGMCLTCQAGIPWIHNPRCLTCGRHVGCPDCSRSRGPVPIKCNRSAVAYTSGMKDLLGQYKYRGNERLAPILGLMLDRAYAVLEEEQNKGILSSLKSQGAQGKSYSTMKCPARPGLWQADLLVPVPVSAVRLGERGFNQAERLAGVLSLRRGIPQLPLLIRNQHTGKQSFKSRSERLADMKCAFSGSNEPEVLGSLAKQMEAIAARHQLRPLQIIIVDDIYTTGSTIRACAEALHRLSGSISCEAEIYSLTWAHS